MSYPIEIMSKQDCDTLIRTFSKVLKKGKLDFLDMVPIEATLPGTAKSFQDELGVTKTEFTLILSKGIPLDDNLRKLIQELIDLLKI